MFGCNISFTPSFPVEALDWSIYIDLAISATNASNVQGGTSIIWYGSYCSLNKNCKQRETPWQKEKIQIGKAFFFFFFKAMEVFLISKELYIPVITHLESMAGWYFIFQNPCQWTLPITVHIGLVRIWSSLPLSGLAGEMPFCFHNHHIHPLFLLPDIVLPSDMSLFESFLVSRI